MKGDEEETVSRRREEEVCKISVDDTYEGVGLDDYDGCEIPLERMDDFEPEETYIIPNPVLPDTQEDEQVSTLVEDLDAQTTLAKAIQEGRLDEVEKVLNDGENTNLLFEEIAKEKLVGICNGSISTIHSDLISPIDLAASCGREEILQALLAHGNSGRMEGYLRHAKLCHPAKVLGCLLRARHSRLAHTLLDTGLAEGERWLEEREEDLDLVISFSLLKGSWADSLESILKSGDNGLLQHPVIEASVDVQWHRLRWLLFAEIVFHLLFVLILSLFLVLGHGSHPSLQPSFEFTPALMLVLTIVFYLPLLVKQLALPLYTDKRLMPRHRFLLHLLLLFLLILVVTTRPYSPDTSYPEVVHQMHTHLSAWLILLAWTTLFLRLGDLPHLSIHLHIFLTVLRKSLLFLATLVALLVGFALAFHILLQKNAIGSKRFQSPINSLIKVVAMMTGELEFDTSFSETVVTLEGSVQLIFIGFFVTANIVIINVLISIAITVLREAEEIRENLAAMAKALAVLELEQALKWLRVWTGDLGLPRASSLPHESTISVSQQLSTNQKQIGLLSVTRRSRPVFLGSLLPPLLRDSSPSGLLPPLLRSCSAEKSRNHGIPVSERVWRRGVGVVRERRELERAAVEEEEKRLQEAAILLKHQQTPGISDGDYTSLYFKDAENQYEQIEGESKYGLRNMKDSLLKELKRDLMKLVKVDKAYSEMHRKSKPVPVRPGLALGVITLQAGAKGLPPALHIQDEQSE